MTHATPSIGGIETREFRVSKKAINEKERTVELSFSSELAVEREFGWEILSHDRGAVDLSRLANGGAFLVNHDKADQVGVVESATISPDRKGRAVIRFGRSDRAHEILNDVVDGIRSLISVSYRILKVSQDSRRADGSYQYTVTRWQPFEISTVAVPADVTVGVGRSQNTPPNLTPMPQSNTPTPTSFDVIEDQRNADQERNRCVEINAFARLANMPPADAERAIAEGITVEQFRKFILNSYPARPVTVADPDIGMNRHEVEEFSVVRAVRNFCKTQRWTGLEAEASSACEKKLNIQANRGGLLIPFDVMRHRQDIGQRTQTAGSAPAGGYTIGTQLGSFIDLLRNRSVVSMLGAETLNGLTGTFTAPRLTTDPSATWLAENATLSSTSIVFGQISMTPKRVGASIPISHQLLAQSSLNIEGLVRNMIATAIGLAIDRAAIQGSGNDEPLGIVDQTGLGTVTYSAAPTWAKVCESEKTLKTANADQAGVSFGWISTPATEHKWKTTVKVSGQAIYLIEDGNANNYPFIASNQMPSGDKTILGNWRDLMIGLWAALEVVVDPYTLAKAHTTEITANALADVAVKRATSFVISTDSAAQ